MPLTRTAHLALYVRIGFRKLPGSKELIDTLDLANIRITPEGNGWLPHILKWLVESKKSRTIYVESVLNERLALYLERDGWTRHELPAGDCIGSLNFYKTF